VADAPAPPVAPPLAEASPATAAQPLPDDAEAAAVSEPAAHGTPAGEFEAMQLDLGVIEGLAGALALPRPIVSMPAAGVAPPVSWDDDTAVRRRLAAIYLRTGALAAARAELESLGGRNLLEGRGLLDLAEVRWRSGDRVRAGEAAGEYLDSGGTDGLGFIIVAEAAAEAGRHDEARGHLAHAAALLEDFVRSYAGIASLVQPERPVAPEASVVTPAAPASTPTDAMPVAEEAPVAEAPEQLAEPVSHEVASPTGARIAAAAALIRSGDALRAAVHLGLALRTGRASASVVLDAIGNRHDPALEIVRGDALRLLGRDDEAAAAYEAASTALAAEDPDRRH